MVLLDLVTLPARLTVAAVDTTRVMLLRGEGNGRPRLALEG